MLVHDSILIIMMCLMVNQIIITWWLNDLSLTLSLSLSRSLSCKDSKIICTKNNNIKFNKILIKCSLMHLTNLLNFEMIMFHSVLTCHFKDYILTILHFVKNVCDHLTIIMHLVYHGSHNMLPDHSLIWATYHLTDLGHTPPTNNRPSYCLPDPRPAVIATHGPALAERVHAIADRRPAVPAWGHIWAKSVCYVGTCQVPNASEN